MCWERERTWSVERGAWSVELYRILTSCVCSARTNQHCAFPSLFRSQRAEFIHTTKESGFEKFARVEDKPDRHAHT